MRDVNMVVSGNGLPWRNSLPQALFPLFVLSDVVSDCGLLAVSESVSAEALILFVSSQLGFGGGVLGGFGGLAYSCVEVLGFGLYVNHRSPTYG